MATYNGPMVFPALKVINGDIDELSSTESTSQENCQHGPIPLALYGVYVGKLPQGAASSAVSQFPSLMPSLGARGCLRQRVCATQFVGSGTMANPIVFVFTIAPLVAII